MHSTEQDEQLGEAIETYLELVEQGSPPEPDEFAARYPELRDDLRAALDGLSLVRGLVGAPAGSGGRRLESGRRIAGYRIVRELGRGGMGVVYEAVHVALDRPVALKVLGGHAAPDSNGRRRFLNEARTAAGLHHTHIVPVFDVGQVGGLCYYAMQRIEGSGLDHVLRHLRRDRPTGAGSSVGGSHPSRLAERRGSAAVPKAISNGLERNKETLVWPGPGGPPALASRPETDHDDAPTPFEPPRGSAYYRWVAEVGREAAEALAYAHHRGIIHRDVKPSNLLVDARGVVWVADFGLARRLADPALTRHDSLLGTPRYMSPEQARIGPIDGRTDVYSLGATLYELLTLRPPFEGQTAAELIEQIGGREPAPLRAADPRIPRDLETIVLKTLAKRPADRYATAGDLAADLARFLNREPVKARRISLPGRLWRVARRRPGMTIVSTAAAAAVIAVATVSHVRIVRAYNNEVKARRDMGDALKKVEEANLATRAAMRAQLWREASVVRMSNVPGRRASGLGLLKEAAALGPDAALKARLRAEAIAFLGLRDVEARPGFDTGKARGMVFGPEGNRLAALSDDGEEFHLWDVDSRQSLEEHRLRDSAGTGTGAGRRDEFGRGFFPGRGGPRRRGAVGGSIALVGHRVGVVLPDGQGLRFFDAVTGGPLQDVKTPGRSVSAILGAPEGKRFVTVEVALADPSSADDGPFAFEFLVNLWDADDLKRAGPIVTLDRWSAEPRPGEPPSFPLVAVSPDGKTVASARSRGKAIAIWSGDDGRALGEPVETQSELTALAIGSDGQLAAAGGGAIRLWDVESRAPLPSLNPHQSYIRLMKFSPNGALLAAVGAGTEVELWDSAERSLVAVLPTPGWVADVAFAPDGKTLAAAGQAASASVWAVIEPVARVQLSGSESPTTALAFRDDGLLALATTHGPVRFWRPGHCLSGADQTSPAVGDPEAPRPPRERTDAVAFDHQGRLVAIESGGLRYWPSPAKSSSSERVAFPESRRGWSALARTADGRAIFLTRQSQVFVWRSDEPGQVRPLALPERAEPSPPTRGVPVGWRTLAASPSGDRLYLVDFEGTLHAWTVAADRATRHDWTLAGVVALAASHDGATLAVARLTKDVALVDAARGTIKTPLHSGPEAQAVALAFAPDGQELAAETRQGEIVLWSLADPAQPQLRLPGRRGPVAALTYDPQGRRLAASGSDKVVDVWDMERVRRELEALGLGW